MKHVSEMSHDEFNNWAVGYVLTELGAGTKLRDAVLMVVNWSYSRGFQTAEKQTKKKRG